MCEGYESGYYLTYYYTDEYRREADLSFERSEPELWDEAPYFAGEWYESGEDIPREDYWYMPLDVLPRDVWEQVNQEHHETIVNCLSEKIEERQLTLNLVELGIEERRSYISENREVDWTIGGFWFTCIYNSWSKGWVKRVVNEEEVIIKRRYRKQPKTFNYICNAQQCWRLDEDLCPVSDCNGIRWDVIAMEALEGRCLPEEATYERFLSQLIRNRESRSVVYLKRRQVRALRDIQKGLKKEVGTLKKQHKVLTRSVRTGSVANG